MIAAKTLFLFILSLGLQESFAQSKELFFNHLTVENGLSQSTNRYIFKDSKGFVWISSEDGLNRFDGKEVKIYSREEGLPDNHIRSNFFEDKKGNIWFSTHKKIVCYERKKDNFNAFYTPDSLPGYNIRFQDQKNQLITYHNGKLWLFNIEEGTWHSISLDIRGDFRVRDIEPFFREGELEYIAMLSTRPGICIIKFSDNEAVKTSWRFDGNNEDIFTPTFNMCSEHDSILWVTTTKGILKYNINSDRYLFHEVKLEYPSSIDHLNEDHLLLSSKDEGLKLFNKKEGIIDHEFKNKNNNPYSLSSKNITKIYVDDDELIWIGINGFGIDYAFPGKTKFKTIKLQKHLKDPSESTRIRRIIEDKEKNIWISTGRDDIYKLSTKIELTTYYYYSEEINRNPTYMIRHIIDSINQGWIYNWSGLHFLNFDKNMLQNVDLYEFVPYALELKDGREILSEVFSQGLSKLERKDSHLEISSIKNLNPNIAFTILFENNDGLLYAHGNNDSLWILDPQNNFRVIDKLAGFDDHIICFYEEPYEKNLWIGTSNGLARLNQKSKSIKWFTKKDGLPNNHIHSILPDTIGNLWLSTNRGIAKFSLRNFKFHTFQIKDGMQSNQFYSNYSLIRSNGEFWMGGEKGVNIFVPNDVKLLQITPEVYLNRIFVNNEILHNPACSKTGAKAINEIKRLEFTPYQNTLEFEFIALEFIDPQKTQYQFKLIGINKDWIDNREKNTIAFEKMQPGNYKLNVRACNSDGVFNDDKPPMLIEFSIATPFWKTWLFRLGVISFIAFIAWRIYKYRVEQLLRIERLRNQISTDLHDDIGATLSNVNILTTLVRQKIPNKKDALSLLTRIEEEVQTSAESLDDIIWSINPKNDPLDRILARMRRFASEVFEAKDIVGQLNFPSETKHLRLDMEKRRHFYLLLDLFDSDYQ